MKRITPRTCLWPLTGCLVLTFCLSIGLTYRSDHHCFAGTCGEWLFPLQARLHVVIWYMWTSLSVTILAFRAFRPSIRRILSVNVGVTVPFLRKTLRLSGLLLVIWVLGLYGIIIGVWWRGLRDYFENRGAGLPGNNIVAAVALTGHLCDVTMGMVLLPVSRNSALASFFRLSPSTTFTFHMVQAYTLFSLVVIHGCLYAAWSAMYNMHQQQFRLVLPVLNPTYLYREVWPGNSSSLGVWRASLIFTGITSSLIMAAMFFTSFPVVRRKHFNLFYFTHLLGIAAVIIICLHASTMLYCTIPGLSMWLLDWLMRLYELSEKLDSSLESLGKGWYCLTLPLNRKRLSGCACHSPLAHFYIHHSESSIREIHPFTTITHLASKKTDSKEMGEYIEIQFLFRKAGVVSTLPSSRTTHSQWTNRLASLVDEEKQLSTTKNKEDAKSDSRLSSTNNRALRTIETKLRMEGPYFTLATPAEHDHVICLVAGTGISGALAIASSFKAHSDAVDLPSCNPAATKKEGTGPASTSVYQKRWKTCTILWSVRETDYIELPFIEDLRCSGLTYTPCLTGSGRKRMDMHSTLTQACADARTSTSDRAATDTLEGRSTFVYISGPSGFIDASVEACARIPRLEWFAAKWD